MIFPPIFMSFFHPLEFLAQSSEGNEENVDNVLNAVEIVIALQTLVSNSCPTLSPFRLLGRTGTLPIIRPINSERCNTLCDYKPDQCTANTTLLKVYTIKLSGGCHVFSIVFSPTHNSRVRRFIQFVRLLRCAIQLEDCCQE